MTWPLDKSVIRTPANINPGRTMPAIQFDRSVDSMEDNGGGASSALFTPPLWLTQPDSTHVFVVAGTINGLIPTNVATNIDVSGTNGTWSIYMHATLGASGVPTAVEVASGTIGVPVDDDTNAYRLIGEADVASGLITALRPVFAWSRDFTACGRDPADPTTTPGIYYWPLG